MGGFDWVLNPAIRSFSIGLDSDRLGVMGQSGFVYEAGDVTLLTADRFNQSKANGGPEIGFWCTEKSTIKLAF